MGDREVESSRPSLCANIRNATVSVARVDKDLIGMSLEQSSIQRQQVGGSLLVGHAGSVRFHVQGFHNSRVRKICIHRSFRAAGVIVQRLVVRSENYKLLERQYTIHQTCSYPALTEKDCLVSTVTIGCDKAARTAEKDLGDAASSRRRSSLPHSS